MPSKTDDIETAIRFTMASEPIALDEAIELLFRGYPQLRDEQFTWIGIAMHRLEEAGTIRFPDCDHGSHEGYCRVEQVA